MSSDVTRIVTDLKRRGFYNKPKPKKVKLSKEEAAVIKAKAMSE